MNTEWAIYALYVVTNAHVIEEGATHARLMGLDGEPRIIATPTDSWHLHPDGDDVAVFPVDISGPRFSCIPWNDFVHKANPVRPGDDIFFLGRYINVEGKQYNAPVARFGHVAMLATEEIQTRRGEQLSYLVEAVSLSGYSGSPVLVFRMHLEGHWGGGVAVSMGQPSTTGPYFVGEPGRPSLLGIDWGHFLDKTKVRDASGDPLPGGQYVKQNSGIAGVVPAWRLTELLESKELTAMRDEKKQEVAKATENTALDSASDLGPDAQFDEFEGLTRGLLKVPKKELDEKRREEKRQ
jgi:Trypsin-like peptidase domain